MNLSLRTKEPAGSWHYVGVVSISGTVQATGGMDEAAGEIAASRAPGVDLREEFVRNSGTLYRFILVRVGGNRDVADELLQECCCEAARSRRLPDQSDAYPGWFAGIAKNLVRRHWRRKRLDGRRYSVNDSDVFAELAARFATEPLPPELLESKELAHGLVSAMQSLRQNDQDLLMAFYFDGRSMPEIAKELALTVKSVEGRLGRARNRLREILTAWPE